MGGAEVRLRPEEHFEALREPVWARLRARHGVFVRDRFDDAYAEWWARELERAARGRPSRASAPAAFVAEAVHRVLIDEARSRARGLARGEEKAALELVDIADQRDVAGDDDTLDAARYEAVAHRVLDLVRDRLTARELQVFAWSFLYLRTTPETAAALGLSEPRVKKDRRKVASKVGEDVWRLLGDELSVCAAYSDKGLLAVCEVLTDHVEDCPECSGAVSGMRRGALAALPPAVLLGPGGASPLGFLDRLVGKLTAPFHRAGDALVAAPGGGKVAAAAAAAVVAVGGGTAAVVRAPSAPAPPAAVAPTATPVPLTTPAATPTSTPRPIQRRRPKRRHRAVATPTPTPAATATPAPPRPSPTAAPPSPARVTPPASPPGTEFGFEQP